MLTQMAGTAQNGIYSIANKFPNIVYTCYGFFSTAWKESAAKILKEDNKVKYYNSIYRDVKNFLKAIVIGLIAIMPFVWYIVLANHTVLHGIFVCRHMLIFLIGVLLFIKNIFCVEIR